MPPVLRRVREVPPGRAAAARRWTRVLWTLVLGALAAGGRASVAAAQPEASGAPPARALTRADAVALALAGGVTAAVGRADTAAARAALVVAAARPNPTLSASYTGSVPRLHANVDVPLDLPRDRTLRVGGARATFEATRLQFAYTRATVRYTVEVAYGQALAARERAALSRESARDADSLLTLARRQRDAGDASDVDVDLAAINAGQQQNAAAADSVAALGSVLDLQALLGLPSDRVAVTLAESLGALVAAGTDSGPAAGGGVGIGLTAGARTGGAPSTGAPVAGAPPLAVAAAAATYQSFDLALGLARRRNALVPSLQVGVEGVDPTGTERGPLPVVGFSLPLPLFNRYQGDVALAAANRERAAVQLADARRTAEGAIARARRDLTSGRERLARDSVLLATARRVAAKTLTGYQAGASALPAVLQAQRAARDAYAQYVTDAVATAGAVAAVRLASASDRSDVSDRTP